VVKELSKFKGMFITLEGGEKLGKTTQAHLLAERLEKQGFEVVTTREPGGTEFGAVLRELLKNPKWELSKPAEMLLFAADRAQHYKEVLKPALRDGKVVICDRYFDSTLVYQGYAQGWKANLLFQIHNACTGMLFPDLTFVFNGTRFGGLDENDTIESRGEAYHKVVTNHFLELSKMHPRYIVVNANRSADAINDELYYWVTQKCLSSH
jgi:dTMP kinase